MNIFPRRSRAILWAVIAIILALAAIWFHLYSRVNYFTIAEALESNIQGSPYQIIITTWNSLINASLFANRSLASLLTALTFACIYRLAEDSFPIPGPSPRKEEKETSPSRSRALFTGVGGLPPGLAVVTSGFIAVIVSFVGWTVLHSWLSFVAAFSTVAVWRIVRVPARFYWFILYFATAIALLISYSPLLPLVIAQLLFAALFLRNRVLRGIFVGAVIAITIGAYYLYEHNGSLWTVAYSVLHWNDVAIIPVLFLIVAIGLVVWFANHRPLADYLDQARMPILLTFAVISFFLNPLKAPEWNWIAPATYIPIIALGVVYTLSFATRRVAFALALFATVVTMTFPSSLIVGNLIGLTDSRYIPGTSILVNLAKTDYQYLPLLATDTKYVYYTTDNKTAFTVRPGQVIEWQPVTQQWADSLPGLWYIGEPPESADANTFFLSTRQKKVVQATDKTFSGIPVTFFHTRPDKVVYRFGDALDLLDIGWEPSNNLKAGDKLIVNTWWSSHAVMTDNYLMSMAIVDANGAPQVNQDDVIGASFTGEWIENTLHFDRRTLEIPANFPPGTYNLVVTVRGTVKDTSNLPVYFKDGTLSGNFAFFFAVTVTP